MSIWTIIRLVGVFCWLMHSASNWRMVSSSTDEETGSTTERWYCTECKKVWEAQGK